MYPATKVLGVHGLYLSDCVLHACAHNYVANYAYNKSAVPILSVVVSILPERVGHGLLTSSQHDVPFGHQPATC